MRPIPRKGSKRKTKGCDLPSSRIVKEPKCIPRKQEVSVESTGITVDLSNDQQKLIRKALEQLAYEYRQLQFEFPDKYDEYDRKLQDIETVEIAIGCEFLED